MKKILVIRFSSIGDIVLTSPVLRGIRQQTGAEVHFLTKSSFAAIPAANPHISKVFSFGNANTALPEHCIRAENIGGLIPLLKAEHYDFVIDLHNNLRSLRVKWSLRRPGAAFSKRNFEKWLLVRTGINLMPDMHIVHRYMKTTEKLGVTYDNAGLDFHIPPERILGLPVILKSITGMPPTSPYIAFVIGATHATKRLPEEKIRQVCSEMKRPILLLGGKDEADTGKSIADAAGDHVFNCCGQLSLFESAELVRRSEAVITHDTGLMHIAAAFRKRIISVWGNTVPAFGMYPLYPKGEDLNTTVEVAGLDCRPCSKIGYDKCPKGHFHCMKDIDTTLISKELLL